MVMYTLMILCAIGMVYANAQYKKKGMVWGRPVAGAFGILAVLFALMKIGYDASGCKDSGVREKIKDREFVYLEAQMKTLGKHLGPAFQGSTALVIHSPITEWSKERHKVMMDALKQGLDGRVAIAAEESSVPQTAAGGQEAMLLEEMELTAEHFESVMAKHPDCDLVLSLVGLPWNFKEMKFWAVKDPEKRQKLVLVNASLYELKPAFRAGYVVAAVITNPDFRYSIDAKTPSDYIQAFDERYLLVHPGNIDEIHQRFPKVFKEEADAPPAD
jgi:hypothetical protein